MEPIISVRHLHKDYITYRRGDSFGAVIKSLFRREKVIVHALCDVSFDIKKGEIIGLLGENGAGKSTAIKILTGVLFPTSGEIEVMGFVPFSERKKYVARIGAVFGQKSQLIWDIPPRDSFLLNKAIYGISDADYKKQLDKMVSLFDVGDIIEKPTRVLSLGERMKCEFIMAMLHSPQVVFLDEPTIGLDIMAKDTIRDFIQEMNRSGVTFVLTTHDLEDIERLAHRVIIINHGEKVFEDDLAVLKKHLGNKKRVHISMKNPIPDMRAMENRGIIAGSSDENPMEAELLVDNEILPMNEFIAYVSSLGELQDIAIKELGMAEIIKSILKQ